MAKTAVVALGGNALTREGQAGTHAELEANATTMAKSVCSLLRTGWRVVLVHGNGPQIGNLAIQQEEGARLVPAQPLFSLGAMTEGQLGSLICLALRRVGDQAWMRGAVALVTHVSVSPDDPAFDDPTKPIGPFLTPEEAESMGPSRGWVVKPDAGRGYRRVVPSPQPVTILETAAIRALLDQGQVVVAAGGGGVPVVRSEQGWRGVDAVIDKDYAAQQLATSLAAEALILVTGVEAVLLHYGTPEQVPIREMTVTDAEGYLETGEFPEGSMGPKVRAATRFLRRGGEVAVITSPNLVYASLEGTVSELEGVTGTRIMRVRPLVASGL
ncbi:MAG: carbamate kinase [Actinomycetota bacterium]|jgi:carbamate kinase|nr:carbamate kinase [Actinomycetota bacterium]MEA2843921.1 carbamate kinase [Actinomycetota bacterium]